MLLHFYALGLTLLALLPAAMMTKNLPLFRRLPRYGDAESADLPERSTLSVLIPARDEEQGIAGCLQSVLACPALAALELEVIVMDDGSTDRTRAICDELAGSDRRLSVFSGQPLPQGWNGKQYACWQLAQVSRGDWLLFIDADVRLSPDALPRLMAAAHSRRLDLLSGFPHQVTETFFEQMLIPLMYFILLGYLPIQRMRASNAPEFAAGCGQLFLARRTAYEACDGHKAIAHSRHDGVQLPRAFRRRGLKTDIFDAVDIATCRMYHNASQVLRGLMKNATEGIGSPRTIVPFTILLGGAAVLPLASVWVAILNGWSRWVIGELIVASLLSYYPRFLAALYFHQSVLGAVFHPLSVALFLAIQWLALAGEALGIKTRWRGRV